ncbi:TRAP transporter small permease [Ornithinibacillus bavariensis]|uniref:TRAP transporter small permease n=1 Tax=Ornithinibacillus bavariensis TaxID=545502 RepID=UPI000EDF1DEC|nr:TRAP transporter small permease [Ornithinibacillus sp.]
MQKVDHLIMKVLYYVLGLLMLAMVLAITAQVISRYIFGSPFTWTEELGRYTFIWMSILGMAVGVKTLGHIALDILLKSVRGNVKKVLQYIINILVAGFGVLFTFSGIKMMEIGSGQNSPSLSLPMEFVYIIIPISGVLIVYFVISNMIQDLKGKEMPNS